MAVILRGSCLHSEDDFCPVQTALFKHEYSGKQTKILKCPWVQTWVFTCNVLK